MTPNLVTLTDAASPAAEAYRRLRVNLVSAGREQPLRTLLVVAAGASEDKATVVANLAVAFAKVGQRVILADCDLRHPGLHHLFGAANTAGITTAVKDNGTSLPLYDTQVSGLRLMPSGPAVDVPSDLLASPAMGKLLARLAAEADIVLLDAPPVTLATDAAEIATQVDGVLLTVTAGRTRRNDATAARALLERVGARLVGAALVNVSADAELKRYLAA